MNIFNKRVQVKKYICSNDKSNMNMVDYPKLNLYININDICNAKCSFCNVHTKESENIKFDILKLKEVLKELNNKNLLNRIAISGGETTLNMILLNEVFNVIFEITKGKNLVTINTNGFNLMELLYLDNIDKIYGIHLSRHHYNDNKNNEIFRTKTPSTDEIRNFIIKVKNKQLLRLNCDLIKGYIDNYEEMKNYLEFASNLDIFRVGFVSLMPLNNFCVNNYVDYRNLIKDYNNSKLPFENIYDTNICECSNNLYITQSGKPIEFYCRKVKELDCEYGRQLVYTCSNKLISGFGKEVIY